MDKGDDRLLELLLPQLSATDSLPSSSIGFIVDAGVTVLDIEHSCFVCWMASDC
jgi:hypothetical protein